MATQVRLTITLTEHEMVKLRIWAARKHMAASRQASLWVKTKLAGYQVNEPVILQQSSFDVDNNMDEVPF